MSRSSTNKRAAFAHQPAHHLIIDLGFPMTPLIIRTTVIAVKNALTLACSIRGGTRIPGFGLSAINNTFQNVYPLEAIRGNFSKIVEGLNSLENLAPINEKLSVQDFKDCLNLSFVSIMSEFNSKFESVSNINKRMFPALLQITIISKKAGSKTQEYLEEILQTLTTTKLKKVQVIELCNPLTLTNSQGEKITSSLPKSMGFVDLIQLSEEEAEIEQFLKTWLLDCNTDIEHICIIFLGRTPQEPLFTLKCDISETIINPLSLPFGHRYQIQTDFSSIQLGGSSVAKVAASDLPVYELEVIGRLSSSGLCESLLFGQPQRLLPTQCWQLEWSEILTNQHCFMSVCTNLQLQEQYLLTKLRPQYRTDQLTGYFILIPGPNSMLLKSVAPAELVLPTQDSERNFCLASEELPTNVTAAVNGALNQLPMVNEYNPGEYPSGLYSSLGQNLLQNSSTVNDSTYKLTTPCHPALQSPSCQSTARGRTKRGRMQ